MQDRPAQGVPAEDTPAKGPLGDTFLTGKRYPGDTFTPAPPPTPPAAPSSRRVFTRVILPLAIFLVAIGALAWVTQYLPGRAGKGGTNTTPVTSPKVKVRFVDPIIEKLHQANWEPERTLPALEVWKKGGEKDPPPLPVYAAEFEVSTDKFQDGGHYDFEFENPGDAPVAVGLDHKSCQCARIEGYVLNGADYARYKEIKARANPIDRARQAANEGFPTKTLSEGDRDGMTVPAGEHGIIRVFWVGSNRPDPQAVRLTLKIWVSPPGKYSERQVGSLNLTIAYVHPARFYPERVNIGSVSPEAPTVSQVVHCWSATRDLDISANNDDPRFVVQVKKLETEQERQKLTDDLRAKNILTRVRSAYRIEVTVNERVGDKLLDLGQFHRSLSMLKIRGNGDELFTPVPVVVGRVQGDVKIGTLADDGAINLKHLRIDQNTQVRAKIWAKPEMKLAYEGFQPPVLNLKVAVHPLDKESVPNWKAYEVRITIPRGLEPGPLPEESGIVLRDAVSGRRIRIPLIGSAGRS